MIQITDLEPFNLESALERTEGDRQLLIDVAGLLREQLPTSLVAIQQAVAEADGPALNRQAHQLAGALGLFSGPALNTARQLEAIAKGSSWEQARLLAHRLDTELQALGSALMVLTAHESQLAML